MGGGIKYMRDDSFVSLSDGQVDMLHDALQLAIQSLKTNHKFGYKLNEYEKKSLKQYRIWVKELYER